MKINNPILKFDKPIIIRNEDDWNRISKILEKMGYTWWEDNKLTSRNPSDDWNLKYPYSIERVDFNDDIKLEVGYNAISGYYED